MSLHTNFCKLSALNILRRKHNNANCSHMNEYIDELRLSTVHIYVSETVLAYQDADRRMHRVHDDHQMNPD